MFTLKNIKHSKFASHETHCYEATLYFNGKKVATVSNSGFGGCDEEHFVSPEARAAVYKAVADLNDPQDPAKRAAMIRDRIARLIEIGDAQFSENDLQEPDSVLLVLHHDVLQRLPETLDAICCDLVNAHLAEKELKRVMRNRVLYKIKGEAGIYQTNCAKRPKESLPRWIEQVAAKPDTDCVLNTMPLEQALAIYEAN